MEANINNVLEKATILSNIFKILLQNLTNDTGDTLDQIGFKAFYREGNIEYLLDVCGEKDNKYKLEWIHLSSGKDGERPVKIELTPFQLELLETTFNLEVKKVLKDLEEEEENDLDYLFNPGNFLGVLPKNFITIS